MMQSGKTTLVRSLFVDKPYFGLFSHRRCDMYLGFQWCCYFDKNRLSIGLFLITFTYFYQLKGYILLIIDFGARNEVQGFYILQSF